MRSALHDGDAARGDGAPEGRGLATPPWDGTTHPPTSFLRHARLAAQSILNMFRTERYLDHALGASCCNMVIATRVGVQLARERSSRVREYACDYNR